MLPVPTPMQSKWAKVVVKPRETPTNAIAFPVEKSGKEAAPSPTIAPKPASPQESENTRAKWDSIKRQKGITSPAVSSPPPPPVFATITYDIPYVPPKADPRSSVNAAAVRAGRRLIAMAVLTALGMTGMLLSLL